MTMKEEMAALTSKATKTKKEKKEEEQRKATNKARRNGKKRAKEIIEGLPKRIKEAAKKGESSVYEECFSDSEQGGYMLGFISSWADGQGFTTKIEYNCKGANEGQSDMNYLTISWE